MDEQLAVARNLALQREWYGESLGDRIRRLVVAFDVSQAKLAEVLGLSASTLSQLMSGRRAKINNPAVLARMVMLERRVLTPEVASGDPEAIRAALEQVRDSRPTVSRPTGVWEQVPPMEERDEVLVEALRAVATPAELATAADLLREQAPQLARTLKRAAGLYEDVETIQMAGEAGLQSLRTQLGDIVLLLRQQRQRTSKADEEIRELRRQIEEHDDRIRSLRTDFNLFSKSLLEIASTIRDDSVVTRSMVRIIPLGYYTSSDNPEVAAEMEEAISAITEAIGFTSIWAGSRESGSIFRRFFASSKRALTSDEAKDAATKIVRAAELQILDLPQSRADSALAEGVSKLLTSLDKSDTAFIQLGSVIVLKVDCIPIVFNLTQLELSTINKEPSLFRDPHALLEKLRCLRTDADNAACTPKELPPQM